MGEAHDHRGRCVRDGTRKSLWCRRWWLSRPKPGWKEGSVPAPTQAGRRPAAAPRAQVTGCDQLVGMKSVIFGNVINDPLHGLRLSWHSLGMVYHVWTFASYHHHHFHQLLICVNLMNGSKLVNSSLFDGTFSHKLRQIQYAHICLQHFKL